MGRIPTNKTKSRCGRAVATALLLLLAAAASVVPAQAGPSHRTLRNLQTGTCAHDSAVSCTVNSECDQGTCSGGTQGGKVCTSILGDDDCLPNGGPKGDRGTCGTVTAGSGVCNTGNGNPSPSPTPAPTPPANVAQCPPVGQPATALPSGQLAISIARSSSDALCTLVRVTESVDAETNETTSVIAPVGRSYGSRDWEVTAGPYANILEPYACGAASCSIVLAPLSWSSQRYELRTIARPAVPPRDEVSRFLERATFGPTRTEVASILDSPAVDVGEKLASWVSAQLDPARTPPTSHRAYFRSRANGRAVAPASAYRPTRPCAAGTRYRGFAFAAKDYRQWVEIVPSHEDFLADAHRLQAEDATFAGGSVKGGNYGYDGTGYFDYSGAGPEAYLEFTYNATSAGTHLLRTRYAFGQGSAESRPLNLTLDGEVVTAQFNMWGTGSWSTWAHSDPVPVEMDAGVHRIRMSGTGSSGPNVDHLDVTHVHEDTTYVGPKAYQAEDAAMYGCKVQSNQAGYVGGGFVDFDGDFGSDSWLEWTVDLPGGPGTYNVSFRYAMNDNNDRPMNLTVNGEVIDSALSFEDTNSWSVWYYTPPIAVDLLGGDNRIRLQAVNDNSQNGPNFDLLKVDGTHLKASYGIVAGGLDAGSNYFTGSLRTAVSDVDFIHRDYRLDKSRTNRYYVCNRPSERMGGDVYVRTYPYSTTRGSCQRLWFGFYDADDFSFVQGNPPIVFDQTFQPDVVVDLGTAITPINEAAHGGQHEFRLTADVEDPVCATIPDPYGYPPMPETTIGKLPNDAGYVAHDPRIDLASNTDLAPLQDGGGAAVDATAQNPTSGQVRCSNAPKTFLNERTCQLSNAADACGPVEMPNIFVSLSNETFETIYNATGGTGDPNARYVYAINGLRIEQGSDTDPPCAAGKRSRWVPLEAPCPTANEPPLKPETEAALANLIRSTSDINNPYMRDVIFGAGASCHADDDTRAGMEIEVDGTCWRHVHQDHLQVFDMTHWTLDNTHPGNSDARNPIKEFAEGGSFWLNFPDWHDVNRWRRNRRYFDEIGRLGDDAAFDDLSDSLRIDPIAQAFGITASVSSGAGVMVCGSPEEVSTDPALGGGTFDVAVSGADSRTTTDEEFEQQRKTVWTNVVLEANDQLRQRMAWALCQILVVSSSAIDSALSTEIFLNYYDIFVRNSFGNYRDILKEVSYSPMMAEMLSYYQSKSTPYLYKTLGAVVFADENYAREVMQLFTIGLYALNNNGTQILDEYGVAKQTYSIEDIEEYARAWTGFDRQGKRGNIEDYGDMGSNNRLDPMKIVSPWRDEFPKMGLDRQYVGEKYPLCADLPRKHFMRKGALYRLLGVSSSPEMQEDPTTWATDLNTEDRMNLSPPSSTKGNVQRTLYDELCNEDSTGTCNFEPVATLGENVVDSCSGDSTEAICQVDTVRVVQVVPGTFYEYIRQPCVEQAFVSDAKKVITSNQGSSMCADPNTAVASEACCNPDDSIVSVRNAKYVGERLTYSTAAERCFEIGKVPCDFSQKVSSTPHDKFDGYHWTNTFCSIQVKVNAVGKIAIVHDTGTDETKIPRNVRAGLTLSDSTVNFFRAEWEGGNYPTVENSCFDSASGANCTVLESEGACLCSTTVTTSQVFTQMPASQEEALSLLKIGAPHPDTLDNAQDLVTETSNGVTIHTTGKGQTMDFTPNSIFSFVDENGVQYYLKNANSTVHVGGSPSLGFRNPVHFASLVDAEARDAHHETDAVLDQYVFHKNTPPFLSIRFIQRFGISNPSPDFVASVANAFRTGFYLDPATQTEFGSRKYGDLGATCAAILLHEESRSVLLDADPSYGSLREPLLKVVGALRSLEFQPDADYPNVELFDLQYRIGQESHEIPSVFSFFLPEFQPRGIVSSAALVSPEALELDGPNIVTLLSGLFSVIKWGLTGNCNTDKNVGFGQSRPGFSCNRDRGDYGKSVGRLTYTPEDPSNATAVIDELSSLLTGGRMSTRNREILEGFYAADLALHGQDKALIFAEQLLVTTPEFHGTGLVNRTGEIRQQLPPPPAPEKPYKAVIYFILSGGVDSYNMLVPFDGCEGSTGGNFSEYYDIRGSLALTESELLPISANTSDQTCNTFALHHELGGVKSAYDSGELLWFANTGELNSNETTRDNYRSKTAAQLFAHNAMQDAAKRVDPFLDKPGTGILGRITDELTKADFKTGSISVESTTITVQGEDGVSPPPITVSRNGVDNGFDYTPSRDKTPDIFPICEELNGATESDSNMFGETWSTEMLGAVVQEKALAEALAAAETVTEFPTSSIGQQLQIVSKLINKHALRGIERDVFYVNYGSFDHHSNMKMNLASRLRVVDAALHAFRMEMKAMSDGQGGNYWDKVALMTTSDFARTLTPNSSDGSDHAWGGHYLLTGGNVDGGRILGKYPYDLTRSSPLNVGDSRGRIIPTTSWDAVWNGIGKWMDVPEEAMNQVVPNRQACCATGLFEAEDLFSM